MSVNEQMSVAGVETLGDLENRARMLEMETLRMFVSERLTAAVEEILGEFGKTISQYQEEIDRQRRQLSILTPEIKWNMSGPLQPSDWIKRCPTEEQTLPSQLVQTHRQDEREGMPLTSTSIEQMKTEPDGEGCGFSQAASNLDPDNDVEPAIEGQFLFPECSETEDSDDYGNQTRGTQKAKQTETVKGQRPSMNRKPRSSIEFSQEQKSSHPPVTQCKVCGESFQKKGHLLRHAPVHVSDCGLCGKHLKHTENMKIHLQVHRDRLFHCTVCGQSFTLRGNLRTHMRIHSGERPHGCSVCGKSFSRRATLVRHIRSHTGEKPFSCSYCGKGFVEKGNLTVHVRTHTGERPYWCSVCGKRFIQMVCYYKHRCLRKGPTSP
ncbi:uncharacterized protein ACJ7VT_000478 [Polymixia lowei]